LRSSEKAIDSEIRHLVELLNRFMGIRTVSSCSGHRQGQPSEVAFAAKNLAALQRLSIALPFTGARARIDDGRPVMEAVWTTVELDADGQVVFRLHIAGHPLHVQRELVGLVEDRLAAALDRPAPTLFSVALIATNERGEAGNDPGSARKTGDPRPNIPRLPPEYPTPGQLRRAYLQS
jgi:hypothetical protein